MRFERLRAGTTVHNVVSAPLAQGKGRFVSVVPVRIHEVLPEEMAFIASWGITPPAKYPASRCANFRKKAPKIVERGGGRSRFAKAVDRNDIMS
jgi:hypothetical protein